jgi:lysophospholipase L1-like esterase
MDGVEANIGLYALGANDAIIAAGGFVDTYEANLRSNCAWWQAQYPGKPLIVATPPPVNNVGYEANAALIRARAATVVASLGNPRITCCDFGGAFSATDATKFRGGDQVHQNTAGHAALAVVAAAHVDSYDIAPIA